jgi:hypothetical protein
MGRPTFPHAPPVPKVPIRYVFKSKKYCETCGWRRREHKQDEGMQSARDPCKRNYCGNCYMLKQYHVRDNGTTIPMGRFCPFPTNEYCAELKKDWFDKRVSALNVVAFIRAKEGTDMTMNCLFQGG